MNACLCETSGKQTRTQSCTPRRADSFPPSNFIHMTVCKTQYRPAGAKSIHLEIIQPRHTVDDR